MNHLTANAAAKADLATLPRDNDPTGLQRAALESVTEGDSEQVEHNRKVAGTCRDAVNLREYFDDLDRFSGRIFA